ncbi:zinc finger protein 32-like [Drosophila rhopaloa]|uniref:Zinc finger protein 32-like n=1 Tax=Drosophila rhopaloa TaxID=1041015 RepID=A0A6P4EPW5_DRORH|nr:zinc finger protein 32-like [Drosophila rhopaloa]
MTALCRTCGQGAEHAKTLFDKEGSDVLYNILKLTGLLLCEKPGLPSRICLSCLLDLNEAIAFRERCIKINNSWFEDQDQEKDLGVPKEEVVCQEEFRVEVVLRNIPPPRTRIPDETPSKAIDVSETVNDAPSPYLVDPLRCEDIIHVKNEPLLSDEEPEESGNQTIIEEVFKNQYVLERERRNHEIMEGVPSCKRKNRERLLKTSRAKSKQCLKKKTNEENVETPVKRSKTKEEKYATRNKWAALKRAHAKEQRLYFCDQCGKTFSEKGNFNVHLTRHKGTKEFQCKECDRKEFTQHLLNLHVRVKHRGELPYVCKFCGQRFDNCLKRLFHERKHKESPDQRPHVCPICKKAFKTRDVLKKHGVVHTGEQPFHCELCQTHFNRRNSLVTHFKSKQHQKKVEEQAKKQDVGDKTVLDVE